MNIHTPSLHRSTLLFRGLLAVLALASLAPTAFGQGAPAPRLIPFQGRLTNQTGIAYDNGQYTITFNLYRLAIGGSTVWTERHEKVSVIGGMVNLFLGSVNTIDTVDFSTTKYLGITVDADNNPATADPEMVPRTMIVPSFAAKQAERARTMDVLDVNGVPVPGQSFGWASIFTGGNPNTGTMSGSKLTSESITSAQITNATIVTADLADGSVTTAKVADGTLTSADFSTGLQADSVIPAGAVMPFAGAVLPAGWLWCDGTSKAISGTYNRLFQAIGYAHGGVGGISFNVPDYRGRFLRGVDGGAGLDPDRNSRTAMNPNGNQGNAVGSIQSDAFQGHFHSLNDPGHNHEFRADGGGPNAGFTVALKVDGGGGYQTVNRWGNVASTTGISVRDAATGNHGSINVSSETRPENAYVNYIIKY